MLALTLVALSVGLSNLAAAIGIGAGGVDRATRLRVGIIFGLFEAGMPIAGLLLGHGVASAIGRSAHWLAAGLLVAVGGYTVAGALRGRPDRRAKRAARGLTETMTLSLSALALSVDNLVAGFALGSYRVSVLAGVIIFGVVSVAMLLAGLEFGARIGLRAGERGQLIGGVIVIAVGVAVGFGALG
ncbi:MAG: manganese efflux pump MntP [Streptosporangiaceae bacterium]